MRAVLFVTLALRPIANGSAVLVILKPESMSVGSVRVLGLRHASRLRITHLRRGREITTGMVVGIVLVRIIGPAVLDPRLLFAAATRTELPNGVPHCNHLAEVTCRSESPTRSIPSICGKSLTTFQPSRTRVVHHALATQEPAAM